MVRRMATARLALVCATVGVLSLPLAAQDGGSSSASGVAPGMAKLQQATAALSADCTVRPPAFEGRAPFRRVRGALKDKRPIKVLAVGSSSTVGIGASSPAASYPIRLEKDLEGLLSGFDVQMIARGISGEVAVDAAQRIKLEVAEAAPDLVVWQVGTNDALARIEEDDFAALLREMLGWLKEKRVDVLLIDPQYVERLSNDEHYRLIVKTIETVARESQIRLVHRYDAMADLARNKSNIAYLANDRLHLNDLGYRCMAEYAARAIVAGIIQAEQDAAPVH